jgi:hypothetical protein
MNLLDHEIKNVLRREEPPADFTARVLARIQSAPARKPDWREGLRNFSRLHALQWATAAALCVAIAIGMVAYGRHQRTLADRAVGEKARAQVMLALHIASARLNIALREVQRADPPRRVRAVPKSGRKMEHL